MALSPPAASSRLGLSRLRERAEALRAAARRGSLGAAARIARAQPAFAPARSGLRPREVDAAQARDVVALEAGFADWSRLQNALDPAALREEDAPDALTAAALAGDDARAEAILGRWPDLPERSRLCALLLGHNAAAQGWSRATANEPLAHGLGEDDAPARATGGWPPLLCLLNSRYRAGNAETNAQRLAIAQTLISLGADVNCGLREADTIRGYRTALGAAIGRVRSPALAKLLLAAGADIADGPTLYEGSAMWDAVRWRDSESLRALLAAKPPHWHVCHALPHALRWNDVDWIHLLLRNDGDPNWNKVTWAFDGTCLHEAVVLDADPAIVQALLAHGANVEQPDRDGRTPLAIAVCLNRQALGAVLREHGASEEGVRPVDRWVSACLAGEADSAERLAAQHFGAGDALATLRRANATKEERGAARARLAPCFQPADHLWLCRVIARRAPNAPPVLAATQPVAIRLLLAGGLDPNVADDDGETPLHLAAAAGDRSALEALLAAGADIGARNFNGQTPLDAALDADEPETAETLAQSGGETARNVADLGFPHAFERAADAVANGDLETLRLLLQERPALATARSSRPHRCTLLNYLGANGFEHWRQRTPPNAVAVIDMLLAAGSDPNAVCYTYRGVPGEHTAGLLSSSGHPREAGLTLAMLSALAHGGLRQSPEYELLTTLHEAQQAGRAAQAAADLDTRSEAAGLALVESAMLGEPEILTALLDAGVDINSRRGDNATALHQAALDGNTALVDKLLARGADPTLRDRVFNGTAAGWANAGGNEALAKSLAERAEKPRPE